MNDATRDQIAAVFLSTWDTCTPEQQAELLEYLRGKPAPAAAPAPAWTRTPPTEGDWWFTPESGVKPVCLTVHRTSGLSTPFAYYKEGRRSVASLRGYWQPCAVPAPPAPQEREERRDA